MSWILGFAGASLSPSLRERLVALHPLAMRVAEAATSYLAAGGLPETCHAGPLLREEGAWAVVGLGIQVQEDYCTFLDTAAWQTRLSRQPPDLDSLNGHFVAVRYQHGRLDCFTDPMGTRTLYFVPLDDGIAFSTRLDWLARLRGEAEIDFGVFGSHWLSFNQWSSESLLKDVQRLGPGGHATLTERGLNLTEKPWLPDIHESDHDGSRFAQVLSTLVHPHCNNGRTVSLSLSGGMDSRLVLAMRRDATPLHTHTFGPDALPDAHIARRIADGEGLQHLALHAPVPNTETCLTLLRHHMAVTQAISPASAVVGLSHFPTLHAKGFTIIDGGMGEITRRKFLDRLLLFNRKALQTGDVDAILPYLRFHGPDFFSPETKSTMDQGFREEVASMWQAMPSPLTIGDENFLDLLRVRTVLPNFYGYEQNRLDEVIQNYMPFAQPALLRAAFQVPLALRRKGRLVRQLIRTRHGALTRYPLVKGGLTHPFWLPALPAAVWTKLRTRMGHGYINPIRHTFLETVKPFVLDAVHSQEVHTYTGYDVARLVKIVEGYYAGQTGYAATVDWWLAFEMWRRALRDP